MFLKNALFAWFEIFMESYLQTRVILFAHKIGSKYIKRKFFNIIFLLFKAAMFILLLEWLLITFAIKFHVRDSQKTRYQITSDTTSKRAWSKCVLFIPFILSGSLLTKCWLHTVMWPMRYNNLGPVVRTPVSTNPGLNFFLFIKALSRIIFSILFRVFNLQIVGKENLTEFTF